MRALTLLCVAGCTDLGGTPPDAGPDVAPDGGLCDAEVGHVPKDASADGLSYRLDIESIFSRKCALGGCHGTSNPAMGFVLAQGVSWSQLVCVRSLGAPQLNRVERGDVARSYLVHKLAGTYMDVGGTGRRMPLGQEPLTPLEMELIADWITAGAADN